MHQASGTAVAQKNEGRSLFVRPVVVVRRAGDDVCKAVAVYVACPSYTANQRSVGLKSADDARGVRRISIRNAGLTPEKNESLAVAIIGIGSYDHIRVAIAVDIARAGYAG